MRQAGLDDRADGVARSNGLTCWGETWLEKPAWQLSLSELPRIWGHRKMGVVFLSSLVHERPVRNPEGHHEASTIQVWHLRRSFSDALTDR